jgi:hypothetical protein
MTTAVGTGLSLLATTLADLIEALGMTSDGARRARGTIY